MKYRSGLVTTIIGGAVMFVSYRLYLHSLGYEWYGLWLVLSTVLNVVQLGGVGLGPALTRLVAQAHLQGSCDGMQRYLITSVGIVSSAGLLLTVIVLGNGPWLGKLFNLNQASTGSFLNLLPYVTLLSVYAVVVDLFAAALSGLGRIDLVNYAQLLSQAVGAFLTVVLLQAGLGLTALLLGTGVSLIFLHCVLVFRLRAAVAIDLIRWCAWKREDVRQLMGFGGWVAGTTIVNASIGPVTRILLARFAGLSSVPAYDLALNACYKLRGVWECAMRALLPEFSRLAADEARTGSEQIASTYRNAARLILAGATPVYGVVFLLASPILQLWLGSAGEASVTTLRILLAATYVNLQAVPPYYLLMGVGEVWRCFAASAAMAAVCLACVASYIRFSGSLSAPMASTAFLVGTSVLTIYLSASAKKTIAGL